MRSSMQHVRQQEQHCRSFQLNCWCKPNLSAAATRPPVAAVLRTNTHSGRKPQAAGGLEVAAVEAVAANVMSLAR
jgi:hypothetical protein